VERLPDHLLGRVAEDPLGAAVPDLNAVVVVDEDDGVQRALEDAGDEALLHGLLTRQRVRAPALLQQHQQPGREQPGDQGALRHVLAGIDAVHGVRDLRRGRHDRHRPHRARGQQPAAHGREGDQLLDVSLDSPVPAADVGPHALLASQHPLPHDAVDLVEADVRLAFVARLEGVAPDEVRVRVREERARLVDRPGIACLPGAHASCGA
jgi:hypothetical protein